MMARLDAPPTRGATPGDRLLLASTWTLCILLTAQSTRDILCADRDAALRISGGIALWWGAMCVWSWARATMGSSFRQIGPAAELETRGPYRRFRHPMYASTIAGTFGIATAGGHALDFATWAALGTVLAVRAVREEARLREQFGARWYAYARGSLGLVRDRTVPQAIAHAMRGKTRGQPEEDS